MEALSLGGNQNLAIPLGKWKAHTQHLNGYLVSNNNHLLQLEMTVVCACPDTTTLPANALHIIRRSYQ